MLIGNLTDNQRQVIIGTVLGGSSLIKPPKGTNYYLSMRSSNQTWLKYKAEELDDCFKSTNLVSNGNTYRINSICHKAFTELHDLLYRDGKRVITEELLDSLRDVSLAIWFLDGGSMIGRNRKNAYINTTKFGEEGTLIVEKYFNLIDMTCKKNKNGTRRKVVFSVQGTERLFRIIAPLFPDFMITSCFNIHNE
jgi:hypothetical protein